MIEKLSYDALENMTEEELNQLKEKYIKEKETLKPYKDDYQYVDNMLSHIHDKESKRNLYDNVGKFFKNKTVYIYIFDTDVDYDFHETYYLYKALRVDTYENDLSITIGETYLSEMNHFQSITKEKFAEVYKSVADKLFALTKEKTNE